MVESYKKPEKILRIISEVNEAISLTNGHRKILVTVLDTLSEVFNVDCCWVQLVSPVDQRFVLGAHRGFTGVMEWEISSSESAQDLGNLVARLGHKVVISHLSRQDTVDLKSFRMARLRSLVAVPIRTYRTSGLLGIASHMKKQFGQDCADLLAVTASMIGAALDKANLYGQADSQDNEALPGTQRPTVVIPPHRA
jgi:GAF domain-containing protein